jgi:hypothetical protein
MLSACAHQEDAMDLNILSLVVSIAGIGITVVAFLWSTFQLRNSLRIAFQIDVRKTITRIERNKEKFKQSDPEAYKELLDVQEELEAMSRKFLTMFGIEK